MASKPAYVWDGSAWQQIGPVVNSPIKFQTTAPTSPSTGDVWVDSDGVLDSLITNTGDFVSQSAFNSSVSSLSSSKANISGQVYTGTHNFTGAALSGAGLDLLTTQSFSAASSVTVNNCFSATYTNYRFVLNIESSSVAQQPILRFRVGGVDNSSANYMSNGADLASSSATTVGAYRTAGLMTSFYGHPQTSGYAFTVSDILNPFATARTAVLGMMVVQDSTDMRAANIQGIMNVTTSYDGFSLTTASGTTTGSLSVYGYRK